MRMLSAISVTLSALLVGALPIVPVVAAQAREDSSKTLDALAACRDITADTARLACFDTTAEKIARARQAGDLLALDRGKVIERKRQQFGLADAGQSPLGGGEADRVTRVTEVQTTITTAKPASYARFALQLANGMVWETIEPLSLQPRPGTAITIRQAGFGGFKASITGERAILVKRRR